MKKPLKYITSFALTAVFALSVPVISSDAVVVRKELSGQPSTGCQLVGINGCYYSSGKNEILSFINEIRREACNKGYINPENGKKLSYKDYIPMKWSSDMEEVAMIRASECTVNEDHKRPNGEDFYTAESANGNKPYRECLSWNYTGIMCGLKHWYDEKQYWVNRSEDFDAGHYSAMISPNNKYVGVSCFKKEKSAWYGVAAEFSPFSGESEKMNGFTGECLQMIKVKNTALGSIDIRGEKVIKSNETTDLKLNKPVSFESIISGSNITDGTYKASWKCSNESVASISNDGKLTAFKNGIVTVTATYNDGSKQSVSCKVYIDNERPAKIKADRVDISCNGKIITNKIIKLKKGKKVNFKGVINPLDVTDKRVSWKSSNKKIVSVNSSGKVSAVKKGKAVVKLYAKDGSKKSARCTVKVVK